MPVSLSPINRRRFLQGTLGGVAASFLPVSLRADESRRSPDVWAFLSDTHIPGDRTKTNKSAGEPARVAPVEHLRRVFSDLLSGESGRPSGVVISGDCVFLTGQPEDYVTLLEEFKTVREAGLPVHFVMGNHDNRKEFLKAVAASEGKEAPETTPDRLHSVLETPKADFYLLDSLIRTNYTPGQIGKEQLDWLAAELDARKEKPAILVAHHNPVLVRPIPEKSTALTDSDRFFDLIDGRKQVKAYVYGHSHVWNTSKRDDLHLINIPATAWRFNAKQPFAWVLMQLKEDGVVLTLRSIDADHPKHNEVIELAWRS